MANIGTTSVPAIVWGPNGPQAPSGPAILAGVQSDYNVAFNVTFNFNLKNPQGQLASSTAALINYFNQLQVYYASQTDPAYAQGRMQDGIGRIYFIERNPALPTTLQVQCFGAGATLPAGPLSYATISDSAGNIYQATSSGTIPPAGGSIVLSFAAVKPGPTAVPNKASIYQAIPGWDSIVVLGGAVGQLAETSQQFELRRRQSVAKNAVNSNGAVLGAVLATGVLDAYVIDNPTANPVTITGFTIPANTIYVAASGGVPQNIANAIWSKKPPGIPTVGNTTLTVTDQNPAYSPPFPSYSISYEIPATLNVVWAINVAAGPLVPADAAAQIQNAVLAAFNGTTASPSNNPIPPRARIASVIYANQYSGVIAALGPWAATRSINVGSTNTAAASFVGSISGSVLTVTRVVSGTLAAGQFLSGQDSFNTIATGLSIVSPGTGTGGTGTYNLSASATLAGATFTGTRNTVNQITAAGTSGKIGVGDVIAGTGIPVGTTITQQLTGTAGGDGVYSTSVDTTASAAAVTCGASILGTAADQNVVVVGIAQEPQTSAPLIVVTVN